MFEEFWTHNPFSADIDDEGRIFARGAQDMKCVGMQYLGAIRSLKKKNITLKRSFHVSFVCDEENFGPDGMRAFAVSDEFKKLNVGFVMDEGENESLFIFYIIKKINILGIASPDEVFNVFYGERSCWRKKIYPITSFLYFN